MTNCDRKRRIFLFHPHTNNSFLLLLTILLTAFLNVYFKLISQKFLNTLRCDKNDEVTSPLQLRHLSFDILLFVFYFILSIIFNRSEIAALLLLVLLTVMNSELSFGEDKKAFSLLASEQDRVCYTSPTCLPSRADSAESRCCGTCSCDPNCAKYGVCCLSQYTNFTHARQSMENGR